MARESFVDRLHSRYTVFLLLGQATLISIVILFGKKNHCWSPVYFTQNHEEFSNGICWMSSEIYYVEHHHLPKHNGTGIFMSKAYFQWTPIVLLCMAASFTIPHLLWILVCKIPTYSTTAIIDACVKSERTSDYTERQKILAYVGDRLGGVLRKPRHGSTTGTNLGLSISLWRLDSVLTTIAYLCVKGLYFLNVVILWGLLEKFLSPNHDELFGFAILKHIYKSETMFVTSWRFPLQHLCDFTIRQMGNTHPYTVQCTVYVNLINQWVAMFVWFWLLILSFVTLVSGAKWCHIVFDFYSRERYIVGRLQAMVDTEPDAGSLDPNMTRAFARSFITSDCYLAIRLVAANVSDVTTAELISNLWKFYCKEVAVASRAGLPPAPHPQHPSQQQQQHQMYRPVADPRATSDTTPLIDQRQNAPGSELKHRPQTVGHSGAIAPQDPTKLEMQPLGDSGRKK